MAAKAVAMLLTLALIVTAMNPRGASADDCKPDQLAVCLPAIVSGSAPTDACCTNLHAQQGCFCQYAKDPNYSKYLSSPNAGRTLTTCGIAAPKC
ncbi:hypothetical protein PR202_gb07133 [Eleusine coracana subsp. coracana]|uniref:Bifunctional inhibitor/plant lipid transfer protein/seed storage helical domain-containing protein n=1 Tax=Eleusine coracana subsp. coracana TaxID=191504 RepID=A0AAV5EBU0_ELECO|nr:hypothetical protein QOZ80_2BG0166320 [Eleusine coracana subsp. coracana]GJN19823.1 hypothetical protein PR202_gb07133 [Eleusine coracana subsp. coracana]